MRLTWFPRVSRLSQISVTALLLALGFLLVPAPSAVAQEAAKPALTFQGDAGLILLYVKAEKTADFEALMAKLKEGLAKIDTPESKQAAAGLRLFKAPNGPAPAGAVLYIMLADPVAKGAEYAFLPILYKAFPAEAKSFLDKWQDVKHATGPVVWDLQLVSKMQ
jgi:hypothetical protein